MYFWLQRHDRLVIGLYIIVNHYHYHYHHQWANRTNKLVSCVCVYYERVIIFEKKNIKNIEQSTIESVKC